MKPDRSNYEIWLIDWLDGNLDKTRVEQLLAFLDENPDLKEEADSLSLTRLIPENKSLLVKELSKKTAAEIPPSQIEYLSVAYLENDLSNAQVQDLKENISVNPENRKLFDTIQRIRLTPQDYRYRNKSRLRKKTRAENLLRLSVIGLSAAATIAIIILSYLAVPRSMTIQNEEIAGSLFTDTILLQAGTVITYNENVPSGKQNQVNTIKIFDPDLYEITNQPVASSSVDSSAAIEGIPEFMISKVPVFAKVELNNEIPDPSLIASNIVIREPLNYDMERSRLSRFIAGAFREKILKDEEYNDAPLKPYEIAEAGIEGINKLLGWEMALVKTSDEEGELKSFYFSSRVLKFNAPVKKSNPSL